MRSSSVVACRAVIMLAALVTIPSAALFWESIPEAADKLLVICHSRLGISVLDPQRWKSTEAPPPAPELPEAPRFEPVTATPFPAAQAPPGPAAGGHPASPIAAHVNGPEAALASYEVPIERGAPSAAPPAAEPPQGQIPDMRPTGDPFSDIQKRLRELGATYYLLESWGDGTQFRFHCRLAIAGSTTYSRQFEATAGEPVAAMLAVLRQAEDWRSGRHP